MSTPVSPAFEDLTPDCILDAVERALDCRLTGLTAPLPSYINRVYELETVAGERLIAKFYRPGRWPRAALEDEHDFVLECARDEIPVAAPLELPGSGTLAEADGIMFALFNKKSGREMCLQSDDDWRRLGALVGRIHLSGSRGAAPNRLELHPEKTTGPEIQQLLNGNFMPPTLADRFNDVCMRIVEIAVREFEGIELQRIHGDCHRGNILERPGEGLMVIDFDDMMTGPPVQDLWLLLPDHADRARRETDLILQGYEQFLEFDDRSLRLVEILRAMRIIYFLAWCSTQTDDFKFKANFPDWGSDMFWQREIADLEHQYHVILNDRRLGGHGAD